MQHAGLQYGQGAVNSHQSPPFAHADISQSNGGNTTSSLRQFRKKDGLEKNSSTDLNTAVENSHIARVPPHNHYPARPNDYYRYQHQFPDYNTPYKETPAQVKYSEIAETPPQSIQHVDHMPAALQKHKEVHKDFMDMCNISQQTHMKQNYPDNLTRQQSYPPDASSVHHQYLHKEPQVHPGYKPESQYQQYPQLPKYNMPSQCRKYPAPPPQPENDFLAKLQRINPSMARSIMSDHHIRESQTTYPPPPPTIEQNRMYAQNQRYYPPSHMQNNISYNYQPYNYTSSCNYKHPEYQRTNQMQVGGAQYPPLNPHADRSISPRNLHMMTYGTSPQKISPNFSQYNPPEYAQHYQHRRASLPQEYYQQNCRTNPYMAHQISAQADDNRTASGGLRHFIENWAEEEGSSEVASNIFKDIRIQHNDSNNEQVFVINSSDIPQCLENVSLVSTENGQFILKTGALDNSVVRIKETTETNGERTVNVQIVEATTKPDCMLAEDIPKTAEETPTVPYEENQNLQNEKVCDEITKTNPPVEEPPEENPPPSEETPPQEETSSETSVIVSNEVSVIKDMPLIDEDHERKKLLEEKADAEQAPEEAKEETSEENLPVKEVPEETCIVSTTKRTQRIFSVDDIMNNIGSSPTETRRNSLQFVPKGTSEEINVPEDEDVVQENTEYRNAVSIDDDSVILEIGGAWVQLNINNRNGTKILSVLPLSESLVIDVNANYEASQKIEAENSNAIPEEIDDKVDEEIPISEETESIDTPHADEDLEEISSNIYQNEVVIGEESIDEVFLDLTVEETMKQLSIEEKEETIPKLQLEEDTVEEAEEVTNIPEVALEEEKEQDEEEEEEGEGEEEVALVEELKIPNVGLDEEKKVVEEVTSKVVLEEETEEVALTEELRLEEEKEELKQFKLTMPKLNLDKKTEPVVIKDEEVEKMKKPDVEKSVIIQEKEDEINFKMRVFTEEGKDEDEVKHSKGKGKDHEEREEMKKTKTIETSRRRDEKRRSRDGDDRRKSSSKRIRSDERRESEENHKVKKTPINDTKIIKKSKIEDPEVKRDFHEDTKKKESFRKSEKKFTSQEDSKKKDFSKPRKQEKKLTPQSSVEEREEVPKPKKEKKQILHLDEEIRKEESSDDVKMKKQEKKFLVESVEDKQKEIVRLMKKEKKLSRLLSTLEKEDTVKLVTKYKKMALVPTTPDKEIEEKVKIVKEKITTKEEDHNQKEENVKAVKRDKKLFSFLNCIETEDSKLKETEYVNTTEETQKKFALQSYPQKEESKVEEEVLEISPIAEQSNDQSQNDDARIKPEVPSVPNSLIPSADVVKIAEEMITLKLLEETKETEKLPTKAAKKLYVNDTSLPINSSKDTKASENRAKQKRSISKLEETVNKIKSMKEKSAKDEVKLKKTSLKDTVDRKTPKVAKKVTFNLETEIRQISKEEMDKKKLSLEEYNSRKRKATVLCEPEPTKNKIMEDTVTSSDDINEEIVEEVELSIMKSPPPRMAPSNWEEDTSSPDPPTKEEVMSTTNRKCIIDVNEFSIKPIESISTPSPVSSSQFSYHSEDDSLQVYKDVVDSKLNSLNIKIPKLSKPKPVDRFSVLLDRFLNKGTLNYEELEEVKKFIEIKRKMLEEEKKLTYEVRGERDYKDLKLHFRKVPEKRKKKRFRNLYAEDSSDSDSSRSEQTVGDYSVYQRDSQGVPKLIFKRKSGLPQPFVKLERSQAVELLAKKRKLY